MFKGFLKALVRELLEEHADALISKYELKIRKWIRDEAGPVIDKALDKLTPPAKVRK